MSLSMMTIDQIKRQIWLKQMEAKDKENKILQKFNAIMNNMTELYSKLNDKIDKLSQTQSPISPNREQNHQINFADSGNSEEHQEKTDSPHHHEDTDVCKQQTVPSPELNDTCEATNTSEATDITTEAVEAFDDEAHRVVKKEALDDEEKLHQTIIVDNLPLNLKRNHKKSPEEQGIVGKHEKVFQDLPIKVSSNRKIKRPIEVKTVSNSVDIRSFHYPHHQQMELEKRLHDLFKMWDARAHRLRKPDVRQHCPSLCML